MSSGTVQEMKSAHRVLAEVTFEPRELEHGYANRWLRVDIGRNEIEVRPVDDEMKRLWVGGKGFDLWLTFQEVDGQTRWDSDRNPICFSSGPLGGTTSYPGSGKTLVTAISPLTDSMIDCNVGGYFGPFLKFAGFDALMVTGKAKEEVLVYIDAVNRKVTIEAAPKESVDSHVVAEELTEMYADDRLDMRNIAVVSAGRAAEHTRMGVLNFSFYDWRRRVPRLKQAGRGGVGTVFRDKKLKALVLKNRGVTPAWRVAENKVAQRVTSTVCDECGSDLAAVRRAVEKYGAAPARVVDMLQEVQDAEATISRAAIDEISNLTGLTMGRVYELVTFYDAFSLDRTVNGNRSRVREEMAELVMRQLFLPGTTKVYDPANAKQYLAPGAWDLLAGLFESTPVAEITPEKVAEILGASPVRSATSGEAHCLGEVMRDEILADARLSCGKCTPCREGLSAAGRAFSRVTAGEGSEADLQLVQEIAETLDATALCAFGKGAAAPILERLRSCRGEFERHLRSKEVN